LEPDQPEIMYNLGTLLGAYGLDGHERNAVMPIVGTYTPHAAFVGTRTQEALEMLEKARHAAAKLGQNRSPMFEMQGRVLEAMAVNNQGTHLVEMDRCYEAAERYSTAQKLVPDSNERYYLNLQKLSWRGPHQVVRQVSPLLTSHLSPASPPISPLPHLPSLPVLTSHLSPASPPTSAGFLWSMLECFRVPLSSCERGEAAIPVPCPPKRAKRATKASKSACTGRLALEGFSLHQSHY
jgi:hypothetical protein